MPINENSKEPTKIQSSLGRKILLWLSILPAYFFIWMVVGVTNILLTFVFNLIGIKGGPDDFHVGIIVSSAMGGFGMVVVPYMLAPLLKSFVAIICGLLTISITGYSIFIGFTLPSWYIISVVVDGSMLFGALVGIVLTITNNLFKFITLPSN